MASVLYTAFTIVPLRVDNETRRVKVAFLVFVECTGLERYLLCVEAVGYRKGNPEFCDEVPGVLQAVHRTCYQSYVHLSELIGRAGEVNQLLTAHRSPVAAIDEQDTPPAARVTGKQQPLPTHQIEFEVRKAVPRVQYCAALARHTTPPVET